MAEYTFLLILPVVAGPLVWLMAYLIMSFVAEMFSQIFEVFR
jgi:hypothetical protein